VSGRALPSCSPRPRRQGHDDVVRPRDGDRGGTRRIPAPLTAERVSLSALVGARLVGSGGLFGYLGTFKVDEGGRVSAALTARRSAVLVRGQGASVLLSPADPDGLVRALAGGEA
jgi:hypothetical protein